MGEFFTPPKPEPKHRCRPPWQYSIDTHWRCECGEAYRREPLGARDRGIDPREPDWHWVRAPEFDTPTPAGRPDR
jgi:hypothetical protein